MEMWRRRGEAASAGLSAAPYSVYHGLYSEAVVSSVVSAVALVDVGRFREAVENLQKAAKALHEVAKEAFERVKVTIQRLVELFVEAVMRVLAWIDEHRAYLFLKAAGAVAVSVALNMWGLMELERLAYFAVGAPFVAGLADAGGKAVERFRTLVERWKVDDKEEEKKIENIINEIINAPLRGETSQSSRRPYGALLELSKSTNLPKPLVELREALEHVQDEVVQDAAVVAALVLYKTLVKNAEAYREWAWWYEWARGLVEKQESTVAAGGVEKLREVQRRLEEAAEQVKKELNVVLTLYKSHSRDLYEKLRPHLEVDSSTAEEVAEARHDELSRYSNANMGTKAYAALLSAARGGIYGHAAMLLMGEGALADIVLLTPGGAYKKAWKIAGGRGEAVDPSYSGRRGRSVDQPNWEDRAASVLLLFLIGYGEIYPRLLSGAGEENLKFRRVEKGIERGFQVFRTFGGIEAPVGELWIGDVARFNISKEELRRLVDEAKEMAPDLSGLDTSPQYLGWRATDVTTSWGRIEAGTVHSWQLRWYFGLLGDEHSISGSASVTKEGIKPFVTARWPREREDQILRESRWLESVLGLRVESWRELVDAIDWSRVLKRVEELADKVKPWIGPKKMSDAEREGLARRMLGELALLAHFAEARRGMDDGRWREERAKRLARAVEALSGGKITGDYADRLAQAIIRYAERREESVKECIDKLAGELAGVSKEEVWGVVERVLSGENPYVYCLARDCARDEVVRKFVEPVLELVMLDKALNNEFDKEEALLLFGEMYATAVAGDGSVGRRLVVLAVGGELGGGVALLRLATLHLLSQLLPKELKFNVRIYVGEGRYYYIVATGEDAVRFKRLLAVSAPSDGGKYLSEKFDKFVEAAKVEVRPGNIWLTPSGLAAAADLTISEAGVAVKYNIYLQNKIELQFQSTDRGRAELAARLLRLSGVTAEVRKETRKKGDRDVWYVKAYTDMLAAGREELRKAIAELVRRAVENGWVDEKRAKRWLEELKRGRVLKEGWPKYERRLVEGALVVSFSSTNPSNIERETQRLKKMGLVEGVHFSVKMPEEGRYGYVRILREGLERAAWLLVHGSGEQQRLAAEFVKYILQRAREVRNDVYEKAREIVEEGRSRGSLTLKGFEKRVEVGGREHVVKVVGWNAELEMSKSGKKLLRIRITAEVDGIKGEYTIAYGRYGKLNATRGYATARADSPGGRKADAERFSALVKALTGREPRIIERSNGEIMMECGRGHLDGFRRYAELADAIERWLKETDR
jgi:hypothetical protein